MITTLFTRLKELFMDEKKLTQLERYKKHREEMEAYFVDSNKTENEEENKSPSGKYRLVVSHYGTKPGCWSFTRGRVYAGENLVADVKRNYHGFPFAWAEGHANGHDYLLCGEDYQGYTVIELDTGARNDLLPESFKRKYSYKDKDGNTKSGEVDAYPNDYGFCWVGIHPSPDRKVLAIDGCYWAAPYEVVLLDFSEPMKLPYWELERWEEVENFDSWETEGKLLLARTIDVRKSDKKPIDDIPEEEWPPDSEWEDFKISKTWEPASLPVTLSSVARKEYERLLKLLFEVGTQNPDADVIRDLMDRPGIALNEDDRAAVAVLSAKMSAAEDAQAVRS